MGVMLRNLSVVLLVSSLGACDSDSGPTFGNGEGGAGGSDDAGSNPGSDGGATPDASAPPVGAYAPIEAGEANDADCDMNGLWMVRQTTSSVAIGAAQVANNWYFMQMSQDGTDVTIVDHHDCGVEVSTSIGAVNTSKDTTLAFIEHNLQKGRTGVVKKKGDSCEMNFQRFWSVRGVEESERFLPEPRTDANITLAELQKDKPMPTPDMPDGEQDWDGDGFPGVAWALTIGTRHTVNRDWNKWDSDADHSVTADVDWADDVVLNADFNNEESIFAALGPNGTPNSLIASSAVPDRTANNIVTFHFIGRDFDDPRADAIEAEKFETCLNLRDALPALSSRDL